MVEDLTMALFSSEPEKNASAAPILKPSAMAAAEPPVPPALADLPVANAHLDRGTKITGQLRFGGPAQIDGHVDGEIDAKEITIGESAVVSAQVRAESVLVCGEVNGEITASERIELRSTAKVTGNIAAPKLIVQDGATFEGKCSMTSQSTLAEHVVPAHRNGISSTALTEA
jgi:cytoskeletal protein CcmA (bactofilin family)